MRTKIFRSCLMLLLAAVFTYIPLKAEECCDTCLKMLLPHDPANNMFNRDSVLIDSCLSDSVNQVLFTKQWFFVILPANSLHITEMPYDTILIRNWTDIDTSFNDLRLAFQNLENQFGNFILRKLYPADGDTNELGSRLFVIKFENIQNIDTINKYLLAFPGLYKSGYLYNYGQFLSYNNEPGFKTGELKEEDLFRSKLINNKVPYHKTSSLWYLYSVFAPLAWEITEGERRIVINVQDSFIGYSNEEYENRNLEPGHGKYRYGGLYQSNTNSEPGTGDLYMRVYKDNNVNPEENTIDGQIIYNEILEGSKYMPNKGAGGVEPKKIHVNHGLECMSMIFPKRNNIGTVGIAPNCSGIASTWAVEGQEKPSFTYPEFFDTNPNTPGLQAPNIVSLSSRWVKSEFFEQGIKDYGITPVSFYEVGVIDGNTKSFMDDIKPFSVQRYSDGEIFEDNLTTSNQYYQRAKCVNWDPRIDLHIGTTSNRDHYWSNEEIFTDFKNSHESKFLTQADGVHRKSPSCGLDILAPYPVIGLYSNGTYGFATGSASYSIPAVAATAGLMRSFDINLGHYENGESAIFPYQIHNTCYDIITFTANKLQHKVLNDDDVHNIYEITEGKEYKKQTYLPDGQTQEIWVDPLQRYWSVSAGYGMLNTYRSVAHAIRNKGITPIPTGQKYSTNDNLEFLEDDNSLYNRKKEGYSKDKIVKINGNDEQITFKYLHLGAFNQEGERVLGNFNSQGVYQSGTGGGNKYLHSGVTIPDYDNCYGTTYISGTNTELTVPQDCILALDGILKQDNETLSNCKIKTNSASGQHVDGKILVWGFLENVALEGNLKIGSVTVVSDGLVSGGSENGLPFGRININGTSDELYGTLKLYMSGNICFTNGSQLEMIPGSEIQLNGNSDLVINNNSTLLVNYGTKITTTNGKQIRIKGGGKLKIPQGTMAEILCDIIVEKDGTLELEKDLLLTIKGITYESPETGTREIEIQPRVALLPSVPGEGKITLNSFNNLNILMPYDLPAPSDPNYIKELEYNTNFPTALFGGIVIGQNSIFDVNEDARLFMGPISSDIFSVVHFRDGCDVRFFTNTENLGIGIVNHSISGELSIGDGNQSKRPHLWGNVGKNPYRCSSSEKDIVFAKFNISPCTLFIEESSYFFYYTDFENVFFDFDIYKKREITSEFNYCTFKYNSAFYKDFHQNADYLPDIKAAIKNNRPKQFINFNCFYENYAVSNLQVKSCSFIDETPFETWLPSTQINLIKEYQVSGINANNVSIVGLVQKDGMQRNEFKNLTNGVFSNLCYWVNIQNSDFEKCSTAIVDNLSALKACNNTFKDDIAGISMLGSKQWGIFANTFTGDKECVKMEGTENQNFRGNLFQHYYHAIFVNDGTANLTDISINQIGEYNSYNIGNNEFKMEDPSSYFGVKGTSQFLTGATYLGDPVWVLNTYDRTQADIYLENWDKSLNSSNLSFIHTYCGRNNYAQYTNYHIYNNSNNYFAYFGTGLSLNQFNQTQPPKIKLKNSSFEEPIIEQYQGRNLNCEQGEPQQNFCLMPVSDCIYTLYNYGNWADYPVGSSWIDSSFYSVLEDFCNNPIEQCVCIKKRADDLLGIAIYSSLYADSTFDRTKFELIIGCMKQKLNNPALYSCLSCRLMKDIGEAYERLGNLDSASHYYNMVKSQCPGTVDSIQADWRLKNISAIAGDTLFGSVYDSLSSIYKNAVIDYLTYTPEEPEPPFKPNGIEDKGYLPETYLEQNVPNPFADKTEISYSIGIAVNVRLFVSDLLGNKLITLTNEYKNPGKYKVEFKKENLPNGIYFYTLEVDAIKITKKLQIIN
jgi:hypothetical protein